MLIKTLKILSCCFLISCSAVEKIQRNTNDIRTIAEESKQNFEKINDAAITEPPRIEEIKERSNQGISQQTQIIEKSQVVIEATSQVKDIVPWWANTIEIIFISLSILGVLALCWYAGLGNLIHKLIGYVPTAKRNEAKLLAEALDSKEETTLREVIAYLRAKDPLLDEAFRKRRDA